MSLARAVAWNTAVQVGGRAVGLIASIAFNALLVRHLGIATYGQFVAASTYVGMFMILGEAGLYLVAVRRAMQEPERREQILGTAFGLRLLWTLLPLSLAYVVAQLIPEEHFPNYDRTVKTAIAILALNEYLRLICQFLTAVFRMHLRMELAVIGEVGSRVVALVGIVVVANRGGGLLSAAGALVAANGLNLLYQWAMSRRLERFRPQLHRTLAREIAREAIVVAGVLIMSLLRTQVGVFLLSLLRPAEDVGIYGVAIKVHEVVITFPAMFSAVLFPVLSRLASEDHAKLRRIFQRSFDVMALAGVGLAVTLMVVAPQFARILGEPRATTPMRLLATTLPTVFVSMSFAQLVLAVGRHAVLLRLYTVLATATFVANMLLIPHFSYRTIPIVSIAIEAFLLLGLALYWTRWRGLTLRLRAVWCVPIGAVVCVTIIGGAHTWLEPAAATIPQRLLIAALAGAVTLGVYVAIVTRLRLVEPEVLRALLPGKRQATPTT